MKSKGKSDFWFFRQILKCLLLLPFAIASGQQSSTMFFMHFLPQANLTNPAVQIPCKVFVGMPALSSIHFNYSNTYFSYNDVIQKSGSGELTLKPEYFLGNLNSNQQISVELQISLLNFGFLYKDYYFNFNLQDKVDAGIEYPTNLFGLVLQGNAPNIGKELEISDLSVFANYYREWALGVSKIIDERLTLGAKAKLLFGKANVITSESDIRLFTSDPIYYLTLRSNLEIQTSPFNIDIRPDGTLNDVSLPSDASTLSLLLNRKNKGFAIDLGAIYIFDENITLSGSLLDVGFIRYVYSPSSVSSSGIFQFTGVNYNPTLNTAQNLQQLQNNIRDSIAFSSNNAAYTKFLSPKLYLGGTYQLLPTVNAGLMLRNELYNGKLLSSATSSVNAWHKNYLGASASWSYINGSALNFGAGISLRTPNFGLYVISDNVYGAFKYKSARLLNVRFGLNFLFGCKSCSAESKALARKGCASYRDNEIKKQNFTNWLDKMKQAKKNRLKGK